jgi:hypothetical protein
LLRILRDRLRYCQLGKTRHTIVVIHRHEFEIN